MGDAIKSEMSNAMVAFEWFEGKIEDLIGYKQITGHMIYDVKLAENFRRKSCFVADGHMVKTPASITYSTVASRDYVRILLMVSKFSAIILAVITSMYPSRYSISYCLEPRMRL